jgi:hypothetical protein
MNKNDINPATMFVVGVLMYIASFGIFGLNVLLWAIVAHLGAACVIIGSQGISAIKQKENIEAMAAAMFGTNLDVNAEIDKVVKDNPDVVALHPEGYENDVEFEFEMDLSDPPEDTQ